MTFSRISYVVNVETPHQLHSRNLNYGKISNLTSQTFIIYELCSLTARGLPRLALCYTGILMIN